MTEKMNAQMDKCAKCNRFLYARLESDDYSADKYKLVLCIVCLDGSGECKSPRAIVEYIKKSKGI